MEPDALIELLSRIGKEDIHIISLNDRYFDGNFEINLLGQKLKADRIAVATEEGRKKGYFPAWFHARIYDPAYKKGSNSENAFNWISTGPKAVRDVQVVE